MTEKQIRLDVILFYFNLKHNLKKDVNNSEEFFESAPDQLDNKSRFFFISFCFYLFIVVIKISGFTFLAIQTSGLCCAIYF